ncbi:MAG TPA: large conductance mechanosensitive channel protein MscL [Roseiflexaceae bacterium]|nr:large conductance mechanosensitive channel protein MscL [Roseiflexaceae bacterium]HMP40795.1 large conductance mechanosensitive channel protein MscL [Roseiflexaceae bacterium]
MLKGFRDFLFRGNVVDLAVAVVIGGAFGAIVTSLVQDVITPLIGAIIGQPDFSTLTLGPILIGNFLNAVVSFVFIATAIYFIVVVPMNRITTAMKKPAPPPPAPEPTKEEQLLAEIRDLLKAQNSKS